MKRLNFLLFFLLFFAVAATTATKVADDPTRISVGARPLGLGKAYVGLADDVNSLFLNPAGLARLKHWQATSLSGKFINEVNYLTIGAAFPTKFGGVFGIGYVGSGFGVTMSGTTVESGRVTASGESVSYGDYDKILLFSYAMPLKELFDVPMFKHVDAGATLKMFSKDLSGTGVSNGSASGYDMDLGLLMDAGGPLSVGFTAQNVLPYSMGGRIVWATGVVESLPATIKTGTSLKILGENGLRKLKGQALRLNFDVDYFPNRAYLPSLMHMGVEWSPLRFLDIRVGIDQDHIGLGSQGLGVSNDLTAGVGLLYKNFRFDYAYHQFGATPGVDNHYFALSYGLFGREPEPVVEAARELSVPEEVVKPVKKKSIIKPKAKVVETTRELPQPKPEIEKPKVNSKALDEWAKDVQGEEKGINYGGIIAGIVALVLGVFLIVKFAIKK